MIADWALVPRYQKIAQHSGPGLCPGLFMGSTMAMPDDLKQAMEKEIAKAEEFSFDFKKFEEAMKASDMLSMVIRGHLYLEHALIQMLVDAMQKPNENLVRRMNFPTKLDMCIALGLLTEEWRAPVSRVNEMRNRVAHRLDIQFTKVEKDELFNLFPPSVRHMTLEDVGAKDKAQLEWGNVLRVLPIAMDIFRQQQEIGRVKQKYGAEYLRRTLRKK
jgi:hypothetical protein